MIVNSFSFNCVQVGVIRVLDAENSVYAVAAADSALGSVERVGTTVGAVAVLGICRCHLRWLRMMSWNICKGFVAFLVTSHNNLCCGRIDNYCCGLTWRCSWVLWLLLMVNVLGFLGRLVSHNPDDDNLKTKLVDFFLICHPSATTRDFILDHKFD